MKKGILFAFVSCLNLSLLGAQPPARCSSRNGVDDLSASFACMKTPGFTANAPSRAKSPDNLAAAKRQYLSTHALLWGIGSSLMSAPERAVNKALFVVQSAGKRVSNMPVFQRMQADFLSYPDLRELNQKYLQDQNGKALVKGLILSRNFWRLAGKYGMDPQVRTFAAGVLRAPAIATLVKP